LRARHFLTGEELSEEVFSYLLDRALELKKGRDGLLGRGNSAGRTVALLFEKPSTRTRVSLEVAAAELGATPLVLRSDELQLSRGESVRDTAIVLSRFLHAIVIRSGSHARVAELAEHASVPVINALTPDHHPCQALADLLTLRERFGRLEGLKIAFVGDGANNVARSLAIACRIAGAELRVAAPDGYQLEEGLGAKLTSDPFEAVAGADAVYTDVWVSMGDEEEGDRRRADLAAYQVNAELLGRASERAIVLHCLPAHPGEEISEDVLYGDRSAVWDQAENRLHSQKALLEWLIHDAWNKETYALWESKDIDAMLRRIHPDIEFQPAPEMPGAPAEALHGREAVGGYWRSMVEAASLRFDTGSMEVRWRGRLVEVTGRMSIIGAGSGASAESRFRHEWRVRDGLVDWGQSHVETAMPVERGDG
jgi:ornithine carbamoyltransferase